MSSTKVLQVLVQCGTLYLVDGYQYFGGTCCLNLQGRKLKM